MYFNYSKFNYTIEVGGSLMLITITGKSGSGKSFIIKQFTKLNKDIISLDIDKVGHKSLSEPLIQSQIIKLFGDSVTNDAGIERRKLSNLVFSNPDAMEQLTTITLPWIEQYIDNFIKANTKKIIILDWALLPITKYPQLADYNILVDAPYELRLNRPTKRDNITKAQFELREQASINYDELDYEVIINTKEEQQIDAKVRKFYEQSIIPR